LPGRAHVKPSCHISGPRLSSGRRRRGPVI
jgi:hypothetical protein